MGIVIISRQNSRAMGLFIVTIKIMIAN